MTKPEATELVLSKSSIRAWLTCRYAWLLGYVHRIKGVPNLDMVIGTATHAGVEAYWKHEPPYDATRAAFSYEGPLDATTTSEMVVAGLVDAVAMTRTYIEKIAPTVETPPTLVEADFLIRVDGVLVSGRIDTGSVDEVRDTKTTSTPSKVDPARYGVDMALYGWGARSITGRFPGRYWLDVVARNGKFAVKPVEPDYQGAAEVVRHVAAGITAGEFGPTGAAVGECPRCSYAAVCRFAKLD